MIWYIAIFMFCFIGWIFSNFFIKNKKARIVFEILILLALILFSGTRYKLGGYDYKFYEEIFNNTKKLASFNTSLNYGADTIYYLYNSLIRTLGFNFLGFTLINSCIFYVLLYRGIKKNNIDFGFFIIIFLYKFFIFNTFVSMRQSLVLVIFLNLIPLIRDKKRIKYLIISSLCCFIHASALVLIPLCFIDKVNLKKKSIYIYSIICFLLFILNLTGIYRFNPTTIINNLFISNNFISSKNVLYFYSETSINVLSTIETYLILALILIFYDRIDFVNNKDKRVMLNIFLIIILIVTFFRSFEIMIRFRDYFSLSIPFILYYCLKSTNTNRNKFMLLLLITIYSFVGYYRYVYKFDNGSLIPYDSYLFKDNISVRDN